MQEEKMKKKMDIVGDEPKKVFDDYPLVDCNECRSYWDSSCDGTPVKKERKCTAYVATRRTDIPRQMRELKRQVYNTKASIDKLYVIFIIYLIVQLLVGWCL